MLMGCRAQDRVPAADSALAQSPAASADGQVTPLRSDGAVYTAVLREHFMRPERGEHALDCEPETRGGPLVIVATTQPLPPGTPPRDSGWANELPEAAAPLMATLRALDREPARSLHAESLAVGVRLVPDSIAAHTLTDTAASRADSSQPPLFWFSRVAYASEGNWALVHAVAVCPGVTEAMAADAENGAYERVLITALEWREGRWATHSPLFLDVGLPRLNAGR